ncbi:MAG: hypothetical protein FWE11_05165 [Defluviitaleaceae bacterium]|nr:hypothetical protein [Defluviitaleaceae bacterium]
MIKRFLLMAWGAGMMSFFLAYSLSAGFVVTGVGIGLFATASAPPPEFFGEGKANKRKNQVCFFFLNALLGMILCFCISWIWPFIFTWDMEPIFFGLVYGVLHVAITFTLNWIWGYVKT